MSSIIAPQEASEVMPATSNFSHASAMPVLPPGGTTAGPESPAQTFFHKGVAISVWQNSGGEESNWGRFTERTGGCCAPPYIRHFERDLWPTVMDRSSPNGGGCGFWEQYTQDIQLAKDLGVSAFRLSLEWHRIMPAEGKFDMEAVRRYHQIFDAIEAAGMCINCTLHHFVQPSWFEDKGGLEKKENIACFVEFAQFAAKEWGRRIKMWATFNEPTCLVFGQYFIGVQPPAHFLNFCRGGRVLFHIMLAHAEACSAMKALPGCDDLQIGLVHHHVEFMPSDPAYFWIRPLCWWGNFWWGRDTVLQFLLTGKFEWFVPLWGKTIDYSGPKPICDWWGVNYYARGVVGPLLTPLWPKGEMMTDMRYTLYPKGLYECFVRGSQLGVPMYVTEIGCADRSEDDHIRITHVESFTTQIFKAIRDGYDVRGMYYWTLMDNFEWNCGYLMKFGLYYWDENDTAQRNRTLKPGGRLLAQLYRSIPTPLLDLQNHCKTKIASDTEYEAKLEESQRKLKLRPVVWNKGRTVGALPLSTLSNKIGFHDIDAGDELDKKQASKTSDSV